MKKWDFSTRITLHDKGGNAYTLYELWATDRTRCSYDNGKTGIPSVSTLAGFSGHDYNGYLPEILKPYFGGVSGTCQCDCEGCYAMKMTRFPNVAIKFLLNTIEAKTDPERFFRMVEDELFRNGNTWENVRLHDSGDMHNSEYYKAAMDFVNRHPETNFGTYTKRETLVNEYGINNIPKNLIMSCSPWKGHCEPIGDLPQFIYDDGTDPELAKLPHCPAVDKHGKRTGVTCNKCKHCYTADRGARWAVHAH